MTTNLPGTPIGEATPGWMVLLLASMIISPAIFTLVVIVRSLL